MSEFRPLAPAATGHFARWGAPADTGAAAASDDPAAHRAAAWNDGYAAGFAAAQEEAAIRTAADDAAQAILAEALTRFRPVPPEAVAARIARGVFDMVAEIVAAAPVTQEEIAGRCAALLAGIERDEGTATLVLHPADAAMIRDADPDVPLGIDPTLDRGSLRVALAGGDRVDGRAERLALLADVLDIAP